MKFCWATIAVSDMEASLNFYQEIVGLPLNRRFTGAPGVELAFLGEGETEVELIFDPNHPATDEINGISLGFTVKSVEEMMVFVESKNILIESGPFQPNQHVKFFYVKDPNGLKIQFVENM